MNVESILEKLDVTMHYTSARGGRERIRQGIALIKSLIKEREELKQRDRWLRAKIRDLKDELKELRDGSNT